MRVSDVIALPVQWGAALRHRKLFHPNGVVASGRFDRLAAPGDGLPMRSGHVICRLSKGVGLPGSLPDVGGVAWRIDATDDAADGSWDVLLASVARGRLGRVLLRPLTSWSNAEFSTLVPLAYGGRSWWLRARIATPIPDAGLALDTVVQRIAVGPLEIDVENAAGTGAFRTLGRLSLTELVPCGDVSFDPVLNEAPGVSMRPRWLTEFRRAAYQRSRRGRNAG